MTATNRKPCSLWHDYGATSRLVIPHGPTVRVYHWAADLTWRWYLDGANGSPTNDLACATKEAAQLAAEDAALALLADGIRALRPGHVDVVERIARVVAEHDADPDPDAVGDSAVLDEIRAILDGAGEG